MGRIFVVEEELLNLLNAELRKDDECDHCQFTSIVKLRETDNTGCNWSSANLRCGGQPGSSICMPFAEKVMAKVKQKYNIKK